MRRFIKRFLTKEDGAVSLDWYVIGGVASGAALMVAAYAYEGSEATSTNIKDTLQDENLPDQIFPGR